MLIHRLRAARSAWVTIPLRRPFAECPYHDQTGNRRRTEFPPGDSLPSSMTHRPRTSVMLGFLVLHHCVAILPGNYCSGGFPTSPGGRRYRFILCCSLLYIYMWDIGVLIAYSLFFSRSGWHIGYGLSFALLSSALIQITSSCGVVDYLRRPAHPTLEPLAAC